MSELTNVITKIRKRDGRIVDFDPERITIAAGKALKAAGTANNKLASTICHDVIHELVEKKFDQDNIPDIEDVQDLVESAFIRR
ncbi:MAG: ATP cone domain-containing protein, partial [Victivallaceae bacterium]